ncbi:MAG: hypothetical protein AB8U30_03655 [Rickettsiales endosymbiont of Dermacentor nuttalli]
MSDSSRLTLGSLAPCSINNGFLILSTKARGDTPMSYMSSLVSQEPILFLRLLRRGFQYGRYFV